MGELAKNTVSNAPPAMGRYVPLARLGDGGMADVFLAVARGPAGFNKLTVIKRLRNPDDNSLVQMFLDEARLSARLSHPNIVQTHEVGDADGKVFMALEYLEGQSLQALTASLGSRGDGLTDACSAFIAASIAKGLHYAHELTDYDGTPLGVVHRDVSPQNVFITYRGQVKLLDFGIAKASVNVTHTETGVLKGKIRYMAPEQIAEKEVDRRVDVFALGIVLWELLARRKLFEGDTISVLNRIARDDTPSVQSIRPDVSPELEAIATKALRRNRNERYATCEEMGKELERFLRDRRDSETEAALGALVSEAFASSRDNVRSRISAFLAMLPSREAETPSVSGLAAAADQLPSLLGDGSGPKLSPGGPNLENSISRTASELLRTASGGAPAPGRLAPIGIAIGAVVVLGALAAFGMRRSSPPTPAATTAEATPAPPAPPASAHVRLGTNPPGAQVMWNGTSIGTTPAEFTLAPGMQRLLLSRDGFETETVALDVTAGASIDRVLVLQPKAPPATPVSTRVTKGSTLVVQPKRSASPPPPSASVPVARPKIRVIDDTDPPQ
jgi:serine/threonine protein kinase